MSKCLFIVTHIFHLQTPSHVLTVTVSNTQVLMSSSRFNDQKAACQNPLSSTFNSTCADAE